MPMTWICLARLTLLMGLPLLWLPAIPQGVSLTIAAIIALAMLMLGGKIIRVLAVCLLLACWMLTEAHQIVSVTERLSRAPVSMKVEVREADTRRGQIRVRVIQHEEKYQFPPLYIWLTVADPALYCDGQIWQMQVKLRPVHARLNQGLFDAQRFALANHTPLQGKVQQAQALQAACSWRWRWVNYHQQLIQPLPQQATLRALAFGDRSALSTEIRTLLKETGTAHLMAISGMHIALAAAVGVLLMRGVQFFLPTSRIGFMLPLIAGGVMAGLYSWISGNHLPAQRAMLALILWGITQCLSLRLTCWQLWTLCIAGLVIVDPLTLLSDSFWLSAIAVLLLLIWCRNFPLPPRFRQQKRWWLLQLLHLQLGMMLLMVPVQATIFGGLSLSALLANLVAIPVVSLLTVPLLLAAMLMPHATLSYALWWLADGTLHITFWLLQQLPTAWVALYDGMFWALTLWGGLLLWRCGFVWRAPASCLACAMLVLLWRLPEDKGWRITLLDVGHGLSVVIQQGREAVLYDAGPRWAEDNAGDRIIVPWLQRQGLKVKSVILSHKHLDHVGGLSAVKRHFPDAELRSALGWEGHLPCQRGEQWQWQQLRFTVLWPENSPGAGQNNDSCVIRVSDGQVSLLLTGDLEQSGERQLVALEKENLRSDILQVPHHGSKTSSTSLFLRQVSGETALASLARYNAWRMPAKSVLESYQKQGYTWYDTGQSGQISVKIQAGNMQVAGLREQILPRWYHQWFGVKRDSR
ncbi:DNA internalization-related competence protein ComEC/Rec2 [Candidatus Pantoea multigeneris]|uniref:DNA internalization-related competence protein ComEC/Rec2 n=1 Tax=Candidatus Pantoea multigeneris TaxID=2608357 RepID=A0ABX0R972_9GAMM|nr:DNA internalization-related competence protein ComEC/Rec2 [Pantoea multigeneris]NIF20688.1 DNA internalization-related competence protein ComEC/Rec2 [Pantoea multigeneris]